IPRLRDQGPDAFDPSLTLETFRERLRRHYGEIKGILTAGEVVAGIGNAYADELLFEAGIYPFRRRRDLNEEEVAALFTAIRAVLPAARDLVRQRMGDQIHLKPRDFLKVHGKGGEPCPRCGERIAAITANQRVTNFCRRCQPGVLVQKGRRLSSRARTADTSAGEQGPRPVQGGPLSWAEWQSLRPRRTGRPQRGRAARGRGEKPA
ncbi:MAG: hypothetical protein HYV08_14035, partial [Deltaproteobacteria bacterium]|nr:hypothetical protein [Deltaproteobacteria bacterium]